MICYRRCYKCTGGELEITDVNNWYIKQNKIDYKIVDNFWSDSGIFESLFKSSEYMRRRKREG